MYADLVCKGGGILGVALVGAINYFEDNGYTWQRLAGTSVGAIVTSLCAVGYTGKELKDIIFDLNLNTFADKNKLQSIPIIGSVSSLFISKGLHSGDCIENFLRDKFSEKGKVKFKDIMFEGESKLKVIATDVTKQKLLILPDDLINYNIDPMNFDIAKAVRMSLSVPVFYNPVMLYDSFNNPCYIVDGGLLSNLPVWIFDVNCKPRWPTFGLNLVNKSSKKQSKNGLFSYLYDVILTSLSTSEDIYFKDSDSIRIIDIPTNIDSVLSFNISNDEKLQLYNAGYNAAKEFLSQWSFSEYLRLYRS